MNYSLNDSLKDVLVSVSLEYIRFYSLNKLTLVEESQSQSADYSWQIPQKITECMMVTDSF